MTTSNIETSFKVNYPMGFCDFSCSPKKKFIDRNNLLNTRVVGLEDVFTCIECNLSNTMIAHICFWVLIILGCAVTVPVIVIYKSHNLWMAFFFPVMFRFGVDASRMRGLKETVNNWNRDVGKAQGVILAFGINQRILGAWAFGRNLDWQWICSCFGHQTYLHICRDTMPC